VKLYAAQMAPSARRVAMYLAEKGIEVPTVEVDFANGEQLTDDFKQINPQCMVPCLELDNGTIITESIAICRYFEKLQPAPVLFGSTAEEIASIEMWGRFCELNGFSNTDITAFITIEAGNMFQLPWDEAKNSIARWYKAVAKRQSAHT